MESDKPQLTARQVEVYDCICDFMSNYGMPPTIRELAQRLGITTTNGMACHLKALEKAGVLIRKPYISRGIVLTDANQVVERLRQRIDELEQEIKWLRKRLAENS